MVFEKFKKRRKTIRSNIILNSNLLYQSRINIISIVQYSDEYYQQVIDFIMAANESNLSIILLDDSDEEDNNTNSNEFKSIEPEDIPYQKHYIIISGDSKSYAGLYNNISSLSNDILLELQENIIYKYCLAIDFDKYIEDEILNRQKFRYVTTMPKCINWLIPIDDDTSIDNIDDILKIIPKGLSNRSILKLLNVYVRKESILRFNILLDAMHEDDSVINKYEYIFRTLFPDSTNEEIRDYMNMPKYMDNIDIEPEEFREIDEIFINREESFSGIYNDDVLYKDIDEVSDEKMSDDYVRSHQKDDSTERM